MLNLSFQRFADFVIFYLLLLPSLLYFTDGSTTTSTILHATCGTNVELTCPIRSTKNSDEVISWFHPNSSNHRLSFIAIGEILLPEYAAMGRFNPISSSSAFNSRLSINNILIEDQGYYHCKSSSSGQHSIKLIVHSDPHLSPSSPILLYPVNRTFSITCSLLCETSIDIEKLIWLANGQALYEDRHQFVVETLAFNSQRLTVFLNKNHNHFTPTNYTCSYNGKESSILVRRRTKEELHRLPRQEGSSSAHLLQTIFNRSERQSSSVYRYVLLFFLVVKIIHRAI